MNPIERLDHSFGEIPHSVQLHDLYKITNEKCASILKRLESELAQSMDDEEELIRRTNLSTILLFHLKQPNDALARKERFLEKYPQNITALVNRVYIKMSSGCEWEADCLLADLKSEWYRDGQDFLRASAFADEAYSLSRIDPKFYVRSIELFQMAIGKFPGNYSWKFVCALSCKRCLSLARGVTNISSDDLKRFCEMAVSFLFDIASNSIGNLVALSWAHLGELLNVLKNATFPLSAPMVSMAISICPFSAEKCLIKALQCPGSQNDESVLERCGGSLHYARPSIEYESTLQDCYTLLVKAHTLRPTSYCCDKLATLLVKMVEKGITPQSHSRVLCMGEPESCKTVQALNALYIPPAKRSVSSQHNLNRIQAVPAKTRTGYPISPNRGKQTIRSAISSTRVVNKYPGHPLLLQAADYLRKSAELTEGTNMFATQKLGLIYRKLDKPDLAIAQFRKILSFQEATLYDKVNAYEQTGFCHLDISENENLSNSDRQQEREKGKFMLKRAVEEAAHLVASSPPTGGGQIDTLESYPTLKQLLTSSNEPIPEHMKDIARLCQLIGNHKEALDWYIQLQEIDPGDLETFHNVVVTRMRLEHFTTAQNYFNMLMGSSEGRLLLDKNPNLFNQVYLGTIRHLMSRTSEEGMDHLKRSCRTVFDYKHKKPISTEKNEEIDGAYDIFILDDPSETETETEALQKLLTERCGLSVTRNDKDVSFGSCQFYHEAGFIANCEIVIDFLGSGQLDNRMETLLSIALGEKGSDSIVSVKSEELELPSLLKGSLSVKRPQTEEGDPEHQRFLLKCFMATLGLAFHTFQWIE